MPRPTPSPNEHALRDTTKAGSAAPRASAKRALPAERLQQIAALLDGVDTALDAGIVPDADSVARAHIELVQPVYREMAAAFREECSIEEYASAVFLQEADRHNLSRSQWAGVRYVCAHSNGQVAPELFSSGPDGRLVARWNLNLDKCGTLRALPPFLTVEGSIMLSKCTALEALPEGLLVQAHGFLDDCTALETLPADLIIEGDLWLDNCSRRVKLMGQHLKKAKQIGGKVVLNDFSDM